MKRIFGAIFMLALLASACSEPPVVFEEPQPKDLEPKAYFEPVYRGVFLCESDSALVYVKAKTIHKEKKYSFTTDPVEIDSTPGVELIGNQLWLKEFEDPIPVNVDGDSITGEMVLKDTLFNLGEDQMLKYFRGHHILNKKIEKNKWEVLILSTDYGLNLRLFEAVMPEDLEKLEKITPVKDISTEEKEQILLAPTVAEFREILRQQLIFQECDFYIRLKLPTAI